MWRLDLIDGHVHADGLRDADLDNLARFGVTQALVCSHDGALDRSHQPTARGWLNQFDRLVQAEAARFKTFGIRPLFAIGVHPAYAPWHGLEELLHALPRYLSLPSVVAIGVLGLREVDVRERYVLQRQLELAEQLRRPVIIAAPSRRGDQAVRQIIELVRQSGVSPERVLMESVPRQSLPVLRALGFQIALEISPGRLSAKQVVGLIQEHGPERWVLTSHAGDGAADLLAVPALAAQLHDAGLSRAVIGRVGFQNALRFLGRGAPAVRARVG